jgi:hypothetical protein
MCFSYSYILEILRTKHALNGLKGLDISEDQVFFLLACNSKPYLDGKARGGLVVAFAPYASKSRNGSRTSFPNVALSSAFGGLFENGRASTLFILNNGQTYHSEVGGNK